MEVKTTATSPLNKRDDETDFEYHKRLVYGKLKDRTLSDYDYSELAPYVYGQEYSVDVARRLMYGSCKTLEKLENEIVTNISDDKLVTEIELKKIELQCERQKFYDQRREFNKLVNTLGREEHLYSKLIESADSLSEKLGVVFGGDTYLDYTEDKERPEAVLVLSDWHYGMTTDNVFNKYNVEICKERVKKVIAAVEERIIIHQCETLHIILLGDFIHGGIHTSCRVASEELVCDQLMQVSEILAQAVIELSGYVQETNLYFTYGNHARVLPDKKENIHRDNWERIIPWWIEQRIASEEKISGYDLGINITPDNGSEFLFVTACGHNICAAHGDLDSVKKSPKILSTLFQKRFGKDIEYIVLGDKHHVETFEELGVTATICGSLCGTDEYANNGRLYSTPSQLLLIVDKESGVDAEYRIKCM